MKAYDRWCEAHVTSGDNLWLLESKGSVRLLKVNRLIGDGIPCYYYTNPVYHVWVGDNWALRTTNYQEALMVYRRECEQTRGFDN